MALEKWALDILNEVGKLCSAKAKKLLCFSYPDALTTPSQIDGKIICGGIDLTDIPDVPDAAKIGRWHGWPHRVQDTDAILRRFGYVPEYVDIVQSRGVEKVVDLNERLPAPMRTEYDVVLDAGTSEHVFNIGQTLKNALEAAKIGGYIIHINPVNVINHGFWSISPTAYHDFYTQNNCEIVDAQFIVHGPKENRALTALEQPCSRFVLPVEGWNVVVVKRTHFSEVKWPMQSKYLKNPNLKA